MPALGPPSYRRRAEALADGACLGRRTRPIELLLVDDAQHLDPAGRPSGAGTGRRAPPRCSPRPNQGCSGSWRPTRATCSTATPERCAPDHQPPLRPGDRPADQRGGRVVAGQSPARVITGSTTGRREVRRSWPPPNTPRRRSSPTRSGGPSGRRGAVVADGRHRAVGVRAAGSAARAGGRGTGGPVGDGRARCPDNAAVGSLLGVLATAEGLTTEAGRGIAHRPRSAALDEAGDAAPVARALRRPHRIGDFR